MSSNLSKPKLVIVSDTAIWKLENGEYIAFEPVVREIEHFYAYFSEITWIGYQYDNHHVRKNARAVKDGIQINYVLIPRVGGKKIVDKLKIIKQLIQVFFIVNKYVKKADVVHSRAPSHPAFFSILLSIFQGKKRIFWHKYAGNWQESNPPFFYGLQRWLLKKARFSNVTVNGVWKNQENHVLSFENPCITLEQRENAKQIVLDKDFSGKLDFCFVGRLIDAKGVKKIIEVFNDLKDERIGKIHLVGEGNEEVYKKLNKNSNVVFHGFLSMTEVSNLMALSHIFLLPSDSEGFPKVVGEASNVGCIPIVSNVSCIGQYVKTNQNGVLLDDWQTQNLKETIQKIFMMPPDSLKKMSYEAHNMAQKFTYQYYNERIEKDILKK